MADVRFSPDDLTAVDRLLTTTRAVRRRLDLVRDIPDSLIRTCIDIAVQAPTGGNRQGWRWLIVRDAAHKRALAEIYNRERHRLEDNREAAAGAGNEQTVRVYDSALYLSDHLAEVPVMVLPCIEGNLDGEPNVRRASTYGAIFPAVWSLMLALRARGVGSSLTTLHLFNETAVADLLGIPSTMTQVCLLPLGFIKGQTLSPAARPRRDDIVFYESWGVTAQ